MRTFLNHLYQHSHGFLNLRAIGKERVHQAFYEWSDFENIEKFCAARIQSKNLYFGVATRDDKNGKKENIVHIPALWCDVDFKDTPRDRLKELYEKFPTKASIIVKSGGGAHFYWLLKEPLEKDAIPQVEDANRRIAHALSGDFSSTDAARILRLPGTINHKYEHKPRVEVTRLENFFYEIDDLLDILPPAEAPTENHAQIPPISQNDDIKSIQKCLFIKWCGEHQTDLPEPLWHCMISNLAGIRPGGVSLCHELSRGYPKYSRRETDAKILHALDSSPPITCEEIRKRGFDCLKACDVSSPAGLIFDIELFDDGVQDAERIKLHVS
jgi:hypothetical protein